ncbi:arachidonate 12-lipoxygenase, 12R-type-like [Haliotis rubra]|uniref:arachidonate 12-lipoxygenase, 12R-type-like n=1 Tax=Haliotis rubra TaxID=36100 RepID=UPI001EE58D94|nr:arachidonate 12-lipoxygenase, 12R-type-like [Haliotis rubra]
MEHDNTTTLPQNDPQKATRQQLLDEAKALYQIDNSSEELPVKTIAHWEEDWFFGRQRLAGVCPHLIRLCAKIPDRLAVQESHLKPFLDMSLDQALAHEKLFYCDLGILEGIPCSPDYHVCAPILLLYRNNSGELLPVAIQLFQEKGPDNPVFLPSDDRNVWLLAKMWYNQAEATYHQSVAHLGITHLLMEGVDLSTHRHLSQYHPIYKLLAPHLVGTMAINEKGRELLLDGGALNTLMSVGVEGVEHLMAKSLPDWHLDVDGTLPEDLKRRGVNGEGVLPNYHYRDDGLKVYEAIEAYVTKYVHLYYENDQALLSDREIQAWANELVTSTKDGGIGMNGVPGGGKFRELNQLIKTLTSVIFTCSAQHAAVNFPQYNFSGFPPAYPTKLTGSPPTKKEHRAVEDVLKALPDVDTLSEMILVANLLSTKITNALGDFETIYIQDHKAVQIWQEFRMKLSEITQSFTADNKQCRVPPYDFLLPENIPNSVSI